MLHRAQRDGRLATTGPCKSIRHPQHAGFVLIMIGFLLQWPTLLTLGMFPILVRMYMRLARREEREALAQFDRKYGRAFIDSFGLKSYLDALADAAEQYAEYAKTTPAFFPRLHRRMYFAQPHMKGGSS